MVHICYSLSDRKGTYTKLVGTSMRSLFEHTEEWVTVHILHDHTLSDDNKRNLMALVRSYGQQLLLYDVEKTFPGRLEKLAEYNKWMEGKIKPGGSLAIWYRLMMGEIIKGPDRIIYLDADTVVNLDIKELWQEKTGENGLAAVVDSVIREQHYSFMVKKGLCQEERYFNSGVLLLDMELWGTQEGLMERGAEFLKEHDLIDYPDQDVLNYFFGEKAGLLPEKYNTLVSWELSHRRNETKPMIYHYANKQYSFDYTNNYHKLFWDNFTETPWCNSEFLCRLSHNMRNNIGGKMLIFSNLTAGKTRVVVGREAERDKYARMLMLREDESFLTVEELNQRGFNLDKKEIMVFFLPYAEYMKAKKHLEACGAEEGAHFVDGNVLTAPDPVQEAKAFLEA